MLLLKKRYCILFTACLTLTLILLAVPASWAIYSLQRVVPGLQVAEVSGTLWRGRVSDSQWFGRGQILPLGQLHWQLKPLSLLALQPCIEIDLQAPGQQISAEVCYLPTSGGMTFQAVQAKLPMEVIAPFFVVGLDGSVEASIERAGWTDGTLSVEKFTLFWTQAAIHNGNQWIKLGNIRGQGTDDNAGGLTSSWTSVENSLLASAPVIDLQLQLTHLISAKPTLHLTGSIDPGSSDGALTPMLRFLGEPLPSGAFRIDIKE